MTRGCILYKSNDMLTLESAKIFDWNKKVKLLYNLCLFFEIIQNIALAVSLVARVFTLFDNIFPMIAKTI